MRLERSAARHWRAIFVGCLVGMAAQAGAVLAADGPRGQYLIRAGTGAERLDLEIQTSCEGGNEAFAISNRGEAFPAPAKFQVVRSADRAPVSDRTLRLAAGQRVTLKAKAAAGEEHAVFVDPSWFERPFVLDARVKCD